MGRKAGTKKKAEPGKFAGLAEIKKLWKVIPASEWVSVFQDVAPQYRWEKQGHTVIKGLCPYHAEGTPSFLINTLKGFGHCFGCGKFVYDPINLVAKLKSTNYAEALLFLHARFDLTGLVSSTDDLNQYHRIQEAKKYAAIAMNEVLQKVIREDPVYLRYCRAALAYLVTARKLPITSLPSLPVGVFAKPEHLLEFIKNPLLHPLVEDYFSKYAHNTYYGAVSFHFNDSPGTISRFKLRTPAPGAIQLAIKAPSVWDIPVTEAGTYITKDFVFTDDPYSTGIGVYGLHKYQSLIGRGDASVYITEGEFDALSVMAAQDECSSHDFIILGAGGKGGIRHRFLAECGVKTIWLVPDHPAKNGDGWADSVLRCKENFSIPEKEASLAFKVFQWPASLLGMDLDEAVKINGYTSVKNLLYTQRNSFFLNANSWVITHAEKAAKEISNRYQEQRKALSAEEPGYAVTTENLRAEQKSEIKKVVMNWFGLLHDTSVQLEYAQKFNTEFNIDISQVTEVNNTLYALDTMNGVAEKIKEALDKELAVSYYEKKGTAGIFLHFWSRKRDEDVLFQSNEKEIAILVSTFMGSELATWMDGLLGDNPVYNYGYVEGDKTASFLQRKKMAKLLIQHTLEQCYYGACPPLASLETLGQGVHFIDLPVSVKADNVMFFVNGSKLFRGTFKDSCTLDWERVENQVSDGVLFEKLSASYKWSHVEDTADLYAASEANPTTVFNNIRTILDGWKFENHDVMAPYLAAYIMALPIMRAVGNVNITFVTGDKESGKTSLLNGLLGGSESKHEVPSLLESAVFMSDATTAAMYQTMEGSSQLFILDEAEQSEKHNTDHDAKTREIMRLIYSLPQGGVSVSRGGATKDQRTEYFLRMPVIMAGINLPADSTFLSRVVVIYTVKDPGRQNLDDYIFDRFHEQDIEKLRKQITVGLLPHIPEIMSKRGVLREKLSKMRGKVANVSNRFLDSILTPLAVYELAGGSAAALYEEILLRYKSRLEAIHDQDNVNDIINACLYTACIKTSIDDAADKVTARHLIMNGEYNVLNSSDSGVYFMPERMWIVIVWRQAKYLTLRYSAYHTVEESSLRERCAKNVFVIPEVSIEEHRDIQNTLKLPDVKSSAGYTVLKAEYLLADFDSPKEKVAPVVAAAPVVDVVEPYSIGDIEFKY